MYRGLSHSDALLGFYPDRNTDRYDHTLSVDGIRPSISREIFAQHVILRPLRRSSIAVKAPGRASRRISWAVFFRREDTFGKLTIYHDIELRCPWCRFYTEAVTERPLMLHAYAYRNMPCPTSACQRT